jgi:phosphatidate cytidylyltransferase
MDQDQSDSGYSPVAQPGVRPEGGGHIKAASREPGGPHRRHRKQPGSGEQAGQDSTEQDRQDNTEQARQGGGDQPASADHADSGATGQDQLDGSEPDAGQGEQAAAPQDGQQDGKRKIRTGRNLPAAIGVGALLGGLVILTLFTVKVTFLVLVAVMVGIAMWEFSHALASRNIHLPVIPIIAGGATMVALGYWYGARPALVVVALTFAAVLAWRLNGGPQHYLRDVSAGAVALLYLPTMAIFVSLLLAEPDGDRRALIFVVLSVCSDTGGYFAGILAGRHLMAPTISPKKTWEGLAGSMLLCLVAGAIMLPELLNGQVWQGLVIGLAAVGAATLGDLVESMIKRDLQIKDMGSLLPGHGGIMDRIDSYLLLAPVVWLLLTLFVSNGHAT